MAPEDARAGAVLEPETRSSSSRGAAAPSPQQRRARARARAGLPCGVAARVPLPGDRPWTPADAPELARALVALAERHDVLRSAEAPPVAVVELAGRAFDLPSAPALAGGAALRGILALGTAPGTGRAEAILVTSILHADRASLGLLAEELLALLAGGAAPAQGDEDGEEPLTYAEVADWQNELEAEAEAEGGHWRRLPAPGPAPALPGRREGADAGSLGRRARLEDPVRLDTAPLATALRASLGASFRAEPRTLILALWQVLAARLSGRERGRTATLFDGRSYEEVARVVGPLARSLPVAWDLPPDLPFADAVSRLAAQLAAAEGAQEYYLPETEEEGRAVAALGFEWVPAGGPEALLPRAAELALEAAEPEATPERSYGTGHRLTWIYDPSRYGAEDLRHLGARLAALADAAAADPRRPVGRLPLVGDAERRQLLAAARGPEAAALSETAGGPRSAPGAILAAARRAPERTAVAGGGESLTFARLAERSAALGRALAAGGLRPEEAVGVLLPRTPALPVALLGIWRAGGAFLPLDPEHPAERTAGIVQEAGVRTVVTVPDLAARAPEGVDRLEMEADGRLAGPPSEPVASPDIFDLQPGEPHPESLAYVLYTSGSTGRPKGVMVPHGALAAYLGWCAAAYGLGDGPEEAGAPVHTPVTFDLTITSLLAPLAAGRPAVLLPAEGGLDALEEALLDGGPWSLVKLTPAHLEALGERLARRGFDGRGLRLVVGGEALHASTLAPLAGSGALVVNEYGPTEATVGCSVHTLRLDPGTKGGGAEGGGPPHGSVSGRVPIGRPIAGAALHLLGAGGEPAPWGLPGEIHIGGAGLARGYLGRPGATAAAFVPDPFRAEAGARLYRTGDLARRLPGGELDFLGRRDDQVKVRGFRIELGEVETVLNGAPGVGEAAVVAAGEGARRRLAAFVTPRGGAAPDAAVLREHLARLLPEPMIPSTFTVLPRLPLTSHGKVDRRRLETDAETAAAYGGTASAAARPGAQASPDAEILAGFWREALGAERLPPGAPVSPDDDFFALGGHSLLATRLLSRAEEAFGLVLPVRLIFDAPTFGALAERIGELRAEGSGHAAPPLEPLSAEARAEGMPVSFAQRRLLFLEALDPGTPVYHIPIAARVEGPLVHRRLAGALGEIVSRHETLRTRFAGEGEAARQVVEPPPREVGQAGKATALPVVDLGALPSSEAEALLPRLADAGARRPFDLALGPLFRAAVLRLGAEDHAVLLTLHHLISDGWSMGVLVRELAALLDAASRGEPSPLAPLPVQYGDFAAWQRAWLTGDALERQLAYWEEALRPLPEPLELPFDRPRGRVRSRRGTYLPFRVPDAAADGLRALSDRRGATLFMTLLAAFDTLLARYTGRSDLTVGTPIANRVRPGLEGLIGFFVNTLALRVEAGDDPAFPALLGRVREAALGAYAHQDLPFEMLVDHLAPRRDLASTPLFQVVFALHNAPLEEVALDRLTLRLLDVGTGAAKFDWTLSLAETPDGLTGSLEYSTDLFDAATAERVTAHYRTLLAGLADDAERRLSALPLLTPGEMRQVEAGARTVAERRPPEGTLDERFAAAAARRPDATAVSAGGEHLSYGELERRSAALARRLIREGVGPETPVALLLPRDARLVVGLLGTLRAGGAYLPLDPAYPEERLRFLLADSGAAVLVTTADAEGPDLEPGAAPEGAAEPASFRRVLLEEIDGDEAEGALPPPATTGANAAYLLYTSGSTGRPKGVAVPHANVLALLEAGRELLPLGPEEVWTLFHSAAFDFSVWELWGPLAHGGRLVVVPYLVSRSPEAFADLLADEGVTFLNQTPSAFRQLIAADGRGPRRSYRLRRVVFGGEALEVPSLRPWLDRHGDEAPLLVNMYGITETTVHVTYREIRRADLERPGMSPIGPPLPSHELVLVDPRLRPAPSGMPGEIAVGGPCLARGYHGRPGLTAERFVPHPWSPEPGARLYLSGDLARRAGGGELAYLGRRDHQVKIRGFRIEIGEIEAALGESGGVRQGVVTARDDDGSGDLRLVAYLVPADPEAPPGIEELRREIGRRVPSYAVPAVFVFLPELPLTPSGKVDRRALPAPEGGRGPLATAYVPPRTTAERTLAELWSEALGVDRVGVDDNYFTLGGDSIRSISILAEARQRGLEIGLQDLFEHQTLGAVAAAARPADSETVRTRPFQLVSDEVRERLEERFEDAYPLTHLQAGMLFHMTEQAGSKAYHNVNSNRIRAPFDAELFRRAAGEVTARHPALRTSFELGGEGEPLARVHRAVRPALEVEDWRHLDPDAFEAAVARRVADEHDRPFDFAQAPQIRLHVARRDEETFQLTVTENHAILDGWSLHSAMAEIFHRYLAHLRGDAGPPPPPPSASMRDFVYLERLAQESEASQAFWAERLEDPPDLALPRGATGGGVERSDGEGSRRDEPRIQEPRIRDHRVAVPFRTFEALRELGRLHSLPFKSFLLAAHLKVLALASGGGDVITGMTTHGRPEEAEGEKVLGLFLNSLPFRHRLEPGSWLDLVREVFRSERAALPHRRFPLAALQRRLTGGRPLFTTQFNYVHFHVVAEVLADEGVEVLGNAVKAEETNLELLAGFHANPVNGEVTLELNWDSRRLAATDVARLGELYRRVLAALAAEPEARHDAGSLLAPGARHQVLYEWQDTAPRPGEVEARPAVHAAFAAHASRAPDAVAAERGAEAVTYGELARRARRVREALAAAGVGPGDVVGLLVDDPTAALAGMLGTLGAGAAYLPLDPAYPADRLAYMVGDARPAALLTEDHLAGRLPLDSDGPARLSLEAAVHPDDPKPKGARNGAAPTGTAPSAHAAAGDELAYVIYTSGSTGLPKGVEVPHRGLANLVAWHHREYGVRPTDRASQVAAFSFDASVWEVWPYLTAGAGLCFPEAETRSSPPRLAAWMAERRITLTFLPTPLAEAMLEEEWPRGTALSTLLTGGDRLRRPPRRGLPFRLVNHYGPTEASVVTSRAPIPAEGEPGSAGAPPIGRPIDGLTARVAAAGLPVGIGVPGELLVGGIGLARGYRFRPGLTADRFRPDPHARRPGGRLYRTGDRVRWRADGHLDFLGRLDQQVKVRGFRIELGEVEAALLGLPEVREAAVLARQRGDRPARLVAYLAPAAGAAGGDPAETTAALRAGLRARLPEHMVPAAFVMMDELPLSAGGKIDRRALAALPEPEAEGRCEGRAPRTELERGLAEIWEQVLGARDVGLDDDFFELGGDSILSLQIAARAHRRGWALTAGQVFEHPTVAELAPHVTALDPEEVEEGPVVGPVPLTPIQHWFLGGDPAEAHHFNQGLLFLARERVETAAVSAALAALLTRHDALRLRFERGEAGWSQRAEAPGGPPPLAAVDLSRLAPEAARAALPRIADAVQRSLDLARGPLLRAVLFELGPGVEQRLLLTVHHLAVDGVSWRVLLEDLAAAYEQAARGGPVDLGARSSSYRRWAEALVEAARGQEWLEQAGHWEALAEVDPPELPVDLPRPAGAPRWGTEGSVRRAVVELTAEETDDLLRRVPGAYHTQINDVLLTALARALGGWTGADRHLVHLEGHGREPVRPGLELSRTVGWFTALFPVVLDLGGAGAGPISHPGEALVAIKEQLRTVPAKGLSYGALRHLGPEDVRRRLGAVPEAPVSFNYLGQFDAVARAAGPFGAAPEEAGTLHAPGQARRHALEVAGSVAGGRLRMEWEHSTDVHRPETVEALAGAFLGALRELIEHCKDPEAGGHSPSDFPDVDLDMDELASIFGELDAAELEGEAVEPDE